MDGLLELFEAPFRDEEGNEYDVQLHGRSRPGATWEGWLVFLRRRDGAAYATPTESTQPSAEALLYWSTGLTTAYFDGAFARARGTAHEPAPIAPALPLRDVGTDHVRYVERLQSLERMILDVFRRVKSPQVPTKSLFDDLPHAQADVVRALEHLEKERRLLVRRSDGGGDWVLLTPEGAAVTGVHLGPIRPETSESKKTAR